MKVTTNDMPTVVIQRKNIINTGNHSTSINQIVKFIYKARKIRTGNDQTLTEIVINSNRDESACVFIFTINNNKIR